jgi:D-serine deaminase-like pyridoxal phosphate-dependent protein
MRPPVADRAADPWLRAAAELAPDTPALVVSPRRTRTNITHVAETTRQHGKALRPHTKTHKMAEVGALQVAAGAIGLQVAKLGEAESGVTAAADDLLIGFPLVGETKLARLVALAQRQTVSVGVESLVVAEGIARALTGSGTRIGVLIDVDTGMHRVGVTASAVGVLAADIRRLPGLDLLGVMTHEGHIPSQARDERHMRELVHTAATELLRAARTLDVADPVVSMGCTGTWRFAVQEPGITELRPGTYVFHDMNCVRRGAATPAQVAAVVAATVVSVAPGRGEFVVDAGSKSLATERHVTPQGAASFAAVPQAGGHVVRCSEEHGVVTGATRLPSVGDRVAIVPNHVCPVVNLYDEALLIDEDGMTGTWPVTGRGRVR